MGFARIVNTEKEQKNNGGIYSLIIICFCHVLLIMFIDNNVRQPCISGLYDDRDIQRFN